MRRILLSLVALSSAALLAACSQGGSAFNSSGTNADRVVITANGNGQSGVAKVLPGSTVNLSALAVQSPNNTVTTTGNYTWTVVPVNTGFFTDAGGNVRPCPSKDAAGTNLPVAPAVSTTNYSNTAGNTNNNLAIIAPAAAAAFGVATIPVSSPYCLVATATYQTGAQGSLVVYVSPSP